MQYHHIRNSVTCPDSFQAECEKNEYMLAKYYFDQIEPNDFMGTCICISYMQIQICVTNSARVFPGENKW